MFLWFMERPPRNKTSRIELLNLVGTARCAVRAAFSGATMPPADSRAGTSQRDVPTEDRFMGRVCPDEATGARYLNRSRAGFATLRICSAASMRLFNDRQSVHPH